MEDEDYVKRVVQTIKNYEEDIINKHSYMQKTFSNSSLKHKKILLDAGLGQYLDTLLESVRKNQSVLDEIVQTSGLEIEEKEKKRTYKLDHDRLNDCLYQIIREWTVVGESDRNPCFKLVHEELKSFFPENNDEVVVFVPGCGLARLPFELALDGFQVFANEVDMFQLLAASFIMNNCSRKDNYRIYPWINDLSNRLNSEAVTTPISFPDIDPNQRPEEFQFQMVPGDFLQVDEHIENESVDAIVTTFFIDSAPNVFEFIDKIHQLLKPGGIWINFGGLNFVYDAFEDQESCIPVSWEVLKKSIQQNFEFIKDELVETTYCSQKSMQSVNLKCTFFTCKKQ